MPGEESRDGDRPRQDHGNLGDDLRDQVRALEQLKVEIERLRSARAKPSDIADMLEVLAQLVRELEPQAPGPESSTEGSTQKDR